MIVVLFAEWVIGKPSSLYLYSLAPPYQFHNFISIILSSTLAAQNTDATIDKSTGEITLIRPLNRYREARRSWDTSVVSVL